jgi:transmembrane 9 superfamily protein 2/4
VKHRFANGEHWTPTRKDPVSGEAVPQLPPPLATCSFARFGQGSDRSSSSSVDPAAEPQTIEAGTTVFTYGIQWQRSEVRWASRWDVYLAMDAPSQVHWFAIVNALVVVCMLSALVAMILSKAVSGDIAR